MTHQHPRLSSLIFVVGDSLLQVAQGRIVPLALEHLPLLLCPRLLFHDLIPPLLHLLEGLLPSFVVIHKPHIHLRFELLDCLLLIKKLFISFAENCVFQSDSKPAHLIDLPLFLELLFLTI